MMNTSIGRGVTSVLVLMAFLVSDLRLGYAYPGDVFRVSTPAQAPSVEDRLTSEEETHSVGESGTAHYTIPITVAPGRQGMQPSVSLSYSSRNPVRGGLAAGWMLTIPKIEVDTSQGRLEGTFYRSSLSGTRLVLVQEQASPGAEAFRAEFDGTYARYERVKKPDGSTYMWLMHTTDGKTWFFGEAQNSQDAPRSGAAVPATNGRWFLSKIVDRFGNSIEYTYARAYGKVDTHPGDILQPVDFHPIEIKWGGNSNASLQHYARVVFDYVQQDWLCHGSNVPIGASFTYRMGYRLHEGAKQLGTIKLQVMENNVWHERRRYVLGYDMEELTCPIGRTHAPLRLLTSVRQTATATDGTTITTLPPVTFEYGRRELELTQKINLTPGSAGHNALSYAKAGGWPTVDGMLLDFDGDGRLDSIGSEPNLDKNGILCGMSWGRNKGDGTFETGGSVFLPTVPWAGRKRNEAPPLPGDFGGLNSDEINAFREELNTREGCSLSHQFSRVDGGSSKLQGGVLLSDQAGFPATYNSYRFMDVTGDGRPDLVTAIDTNRGKYHPESDTRLWPPSNPHPACLDYGPCRDINGKSTMCWVMAPIIKTATVTPRPTPPPGITSPQPEDTQPPPPTTPGPPPGIAPGLPLDILSRPLAGPIGDGGPINPNGPEMCPVETCPDPSCAFGSTIDGGGDCRCNSQFCGSNYLGSIGSEYAPPIDIRQGDVPELEAGKEIVLNFWEGPTQDRFGFVGQEGTPGSPHGNVKALQWPEFFCGRNVLRVYENTGSGFASQAKIVYSPIPLETDRETSALGAGHLAASSSWHGFLDIDGDGFLDAVYNPPIYVPAGFNPAVFKVFRGDGTGNFRADAGGKPYEWPVPVFNTVPTEVKARVKLQSREKIRFPLLNSKNEIRSTRTMVSLQDMNGDGLPDYVDARFSANGEFDSTTGGRVHVFYNTGTGFVSSPATLEVPTWGSEIYRAFEETQDFSFQQLDPTYAYPLKEGLWSRAVAQVVDIDVDGLPDLVLLSSPLPNLTNPYVPNPKGPSARLFVNVGDKLVPMGRTDKTDQWWSALARITISKANGPWSVYTDFVDLDGDGLPEAGINSDPMARCVPDEQGIYVECIPEDRSLTSPRDGQGMRLLRTINNGRGGTVQFDYKPLGADAGGRVPYPLWVVKSVTVNAGPGADGIASVPSTTEYSYQEPVYNQDSQGDWGFRGFTSVKMKSPSGAVRFTNYDYSLHWGGLPVGEQIFDADNGRPHRMTKSVWSADPLLNNKIITHHRREVETRTCQGDQTVQTCATNGDPRFDLYQWEALAPNIGPPPVGIPLLALLYVEASHWAGDTRNAETTTGSQGRKTLYHLLSTPMEYRLLPQEDQRWVVDPQPMVVGKTLHQYDQTLLVELETIEYPDPNPIPQSEFKTVRTYDDLKTGNLLTVTRPNQVGTPNPPLKLDYDSRQLFVIRTTNELGHQVDATYDLGTGVQLSSRGPNAKGDIKEGWDRTIDGFGRVLEEKVAIDPPQDPTQPYRYEIIARNEYYDDLMTAPATFLNGHTGVISRKLIEFDENRWTTTATEVDGLGRVVATKALAEQAPLAVSKFFYNAAGNLVKADLPAPDKAPGSDIVSYNLTYDPQGRRTSALRPDQTGQHWVYDGRSTTREDVVTNDREVVSRTRTMTDVFDRLIQTEEQLTNGDWALTSYGYDGNDNVRQIRNADGIETRMEHDWLSRRVKVIRGGQTWGYGYDKNGNMTSIVAPAPSNFPNLTPADFSTTITYDALDRPLTRIAGNRGLSSEKLADYGQSSTTYEYDQPGINAIGRLTKVSQPHGFMELSYEARGLVDRETRQFSILGGKVNDTRTMTRSYNALGAVKSLTYADEAGANAPPTSVLYTYDDRGLPLQAYWAGHDGVLGQTQYTASGLVALRSGKLDDSIEHQTTYIHDDLGRTTQQLVKAKPHNGQALLPLSDQHYSYTGSDDVATWDTTLGAGGPLVEAKWTFGYDAQHQLTQATGPLGYQAAFAYSPGGRIMSANVNAANGAKRVHRRAATYDYTPFDPEAPDVLKLSNGNPWMSLRYDEAGNLSERTIGGKVWQHVNDGADLQREVVRPDGTRELYWYNHGRQRSLIATLSPEGVIGRVRWVFGETEIWYDRNGKVTKTLANVSMNGMLARIENGTQARFLFQSPRGDVLLALDQQWQPTTPVAADFTYGPYGEAVEEKGTDSKQVLERFNGKQFDQISELAYYGYRYYDERSLTWTQADPLFRFAPDIAMDQPRRFSTYAFTLNNPLRYLDLDGLNSDDSSTGDNEQTYTCENFRACTKAEWEAQQRESEYIVEKKKIEDAYVKYKAGWDEATKKNDEKCNLEGWECLVVRFATKSDTGTAVSVGAAVAAPVALYYALQGAAIAAPVIVKGAVAEAQMLVQGVKLVATTPAGIAGVTGGLTAGTKYVADVAAGKKTYTNWEFGMDVTTGVGMGLSPFSYPGAEPTARKFVESLVSGYTKGTFRP